MQFRCYHCGCNTFRILRQPDTVECLKCGQSSPFHISKISAHDKPKMPSIASPQCDGRSFMVLHGNPIEFKCLTCGAVSPFPVPRGGTRSKGRAQSAAFMRPKEDDHLLFHRPLRILFRHRISFKSNLPHASADSS